MSQRPRTAGESTAKWTTKFMAGLANVIKALFITVAPPAFILVDLALGPQFIDAWSEVHGFSLTGLRAAIPWALSAAMSGLQYALWERMEYGVAGASRMTKVMLALAWLLALADTVTDVGGFTARRYGADAGANIVPSDPDIYWMIAAPLVAAACLTHEWLLQKLLGRRSHRTDNDDSFGAGLVRGAVYLGGIELNFAKTVCIPLGTVCMFGLDLILTTQIGPAGDPSIWATVIPWGLSIGLTGLQFLVWDYYEKVGLKDAQEQGGRWAVAFLAWGIAILDTVLDVVGFTTAIYGGGEHVILVPPHPTWTWGLCAFIIASLCFAGERLTREILWRPKHGASTQDGSAYDADYEVR